MKDEKVIHPGHYNYGKFETIDIIKDSLGQEGYENFVIGNVLKYVLRYKHKNGYEDLRKAKNYLEMLLKNVEEKM